MRYQVDVTGLRGSRHAVNVIGPANGRHQVDVAFGKTGPRGPQGPTSVWVSDDPPPDDSYVWVDTDDEDALAVPPGGTDGQMLAKASDDDYDLEWVDPPSGGGSGLKLMGVQKWNTYVSGTTNRASYLTTDHNTQAGFDRFRVSVGAQNPLAGYPAMVYQAAPWFNYEHVGEEFATWNNNWTDQSWYAYAGGATADTYSWPFTLTPGFYKWYYQLWVGSVTNGNVTEDQAISQATSGLWLDAYDINFTILPGQMLSNVLRVKTGSTYGSFRYIHGSILLPDTQPVWYIDTAQSIFELNVTRSVTVYYRGSFMIEKYAV